MGLHMKIEQLERISRKNHIIISGLATENKNGNELKPDLVTSLQMNFKPKLK